MALDTTLDWQSLLNFGGIWPRTLSDPGASDIDTQGEQNVFLGLSADITPAATAGDSTVVQNEILTGFGYFMMARAMMNARGHSRGKR